ncbi:MAG: fibrobacter succinogenes major paralogous domain-containing protein [Flavobacteriales bacterium]
MRYFFTLLALAMMSSVSAQTVLPPNYPYNPDADGDEFVAVSDVLMSVASYDNGFQAQPIMVDTLSLEEAIQILLQQQIQNQQSLDNQQALINGLSNALSNVEGFDACAFQWTCGCPLSYQGYDYETIQIGEQCWFAENLSSVFYRNGEAIQSQLSAEDWINTNGGAVSVYGFDPESACWHSSPDLDACDDSLSLGSFGRLYNGYAVSDERGLCPAGWHVASLDEWSQLLETADSMFPEAVGLTLKSSDGWSDGGNGNDDLGFTARPGGARYWNDARYAGAGGNGFWWTSTPADTLYWGIRATAGSESISGYTGYKNTAVSVRCVQDSE